MSGQWRGYVFIYDFLAFEDSKTLPKAMVFSDISLSVGGVRKLRRLNSLSH